MYHAGLEAGDNKPVLRLTIFKLKPASPGLLGWVQAQQPNPAQEFTV